MHKRKTLYIFIFGCLLLSFLQLDNESSPRISHNPQEEINYTPKINSDLNWNFSDLNVLMYISTGFGNNYYSVRDLLLSWNITVTTIGIYETLVNCPNRARQTVTVNQSVDETLEIGVENYDALFIPSGGHWEGALITRSLQTLISEANKAGLVIGSMCVGVRVLGGSEEVVKNKYLTGWSFEPGTEYADIECTFLAGADVVTDYPLVTGGKGGGPAGGGYVNAPYKEFSRAFVQAILQKHYFSGITVEPIDTTAEGQKGYRVTLNITDLSDFFTNFPQAATPSIERVSLILEPSSNQGSPIMVIISENEDGVYTKDIDLPKNENYQAELRIKTDLDEYEIHANVYSFKNRAIPGYTGIGFMVTAAVVILSLARRKKYLK